jgi:hypothetical protein
VHTDSQHVPHITWMMGQVRVRQDGELITVVCSVCILCAFLCSGVIQIIGGLIVGGTMSGIRQTPLRL